MLQIVAENSKQYLNDVTGTQTTTKTLVDVASSDEFKPKVNND
jgi:hypothetical protein